MLFSEFTLPAKLIQTMTEAGITEPTPIQTATLTTALAGKDILATAQTGSGKTFAYAIPLIAQLMNNPDSAALVLAPTRELAAQIQTAIYQLMGPRPAIRIALLIGGDSMFRQFKQLDAGPRIIVGTPGRIRDHIERGSLSLEVADFLVIDEADRMLDMGFGVQLEYLAKHLPTERQTLMFSATLPPNIVKLANQYLREPERISVNSTQQPAANIKQEIIHTTMTDKFAHLERELTKREGSIIVFVKTKRGAEHLAEKLSRHDHSAEAIHGDLRQRQRDRVIQDFRDHAFRIMVATDVAARGIDIPHIRHVINFDLPQCPEDYIHRIGRTARAGKEGEALCLISPEDNSKWRAIHRLLNPGQKDEFRGGKGNPRGPKGPRSNTGKAMSLKRKAPGGKTGSRFSHGFNDRFPSL